MQNCMGIWYIIWATALKYFKFWNGGNRYLIFCLKWKCTSNNKNKTKKLRKLPGNNPHMYKSGRPKEFHGRVILNCNESFKQFSVQREKWPNSFLQSQHNTDSKTWQNACTSTHERLISRWVCGLSVSWCWCLWPWPQSCSWNAFSPVVLTIALYSMTFLLPSFYERGSLYPEASQRLSEGMSVALKHPCKVTAPALELSPWLRKAQTLTHRVRRGMR